MTAQEAGPGAQAPGAPSPGGQGLGAGSLAPGEQQVLLTVEQLEQINEVAKEMEEQLEKVFKDECYWIGYRLDDINANSEYYSYTHSALITYRDIAFEYELTADIAESIVRIIDVCKKAETMKLVDYAPDVRGVIKRLKEIIEEETEYGEDDEDRAERLAWLTELVKDMQEMTYADFLSNSEEIVEKLFEYGYDDEARDLADCIDVNTMLTDAIIEELRFLGKKLNIEHEVEKEIDCIVGC